MQITKYLHHAKKDKNGLVPIWFSLTSGGWQYRFPSGEKINAKFFEAGMVTSKQKGYLDKNYRLMALYSYLAEFGEKMGKTLTRQQLVDHVKKYRTVPIQTSEPEQIPTLSFFDLYEAWVKEQKSKISPVSRGKISKQTIVSLNASKSRLLAFEKDKKYPLSLSAMDHKFYTAFREYMLSDLDQSVNTFSKHIRRVKSFLRWCEDNDHPVNSKYRRFETFDLYGHVDALTEAELITIYNLEFNNDDTRIFIHQMAKLEAHPINGLQVEQRVKALEEARDVFLMCCYTGLRRSDIWRLGAKHIQGELIRITTQKTNITCYIPFFDDSIFRPVELVEKYRDKHKTLLPVNTHINRYLKYIQKLAGIDRLTLTSKIGRKTFTTLKIYQGVPTRLIMAATGHKTESSFNRYAGLDTEKLIQEFKDKSRF